MKHVGLKEWVATARPRTLAFAIMPVAVAASVAWRYQPWGAGSSTGYCMVTNAKRLVYSESCNQGFQLRYWLLVAMCAVVALSLQIAANFALDYFDGKRLTDPSTMYDIPTGSQVKSSREVGVRGHLTASGKVDPSAVAFTAGIFALISLFASVVIVIWTLQFVLLLVEAVCLLAVWLYVGGTHPLAYAGFGELMAFVVYGIVGVFGAAISLMVSVSISLQVAVIGTAGAYIAVLVLTDNLRNFDEDKKAKRRTLPQIIGTKWSLILLSVLLALGLCCTVFSVVIMGVVPDSRIGLWWILIGVVLVGLAYHGVAIVTLSARGLFNKVFKMACPAALMASLSYVLVAALS